jgi:hypothetical protein
MWHNNNTLRCSLKRLQLHTPPTRYTFIGNVTVLVVQLVIIPLQLQASPLFQVYIMKERAIGPLARPFKQVTGANWMGDWVERVEKVDWKKAKGGKKLR